MKIRSNNSQYYEVGGHRFSVSSSIDMDVASLLPSYQIFSVSPVGRKYLFSLILVNKLEKLFSSIELANLKLDEANCIIKETDSEYEIEITPEQDGITRRMIVDKSFSEAKAELIDITPIDIMVLNNFIMMLYAFSSASYNTLLIHASVINYKNKGYLFLGKSGTGKSTHARLWIENVDSAKLLNDDNPVIRIDSEGKAMVYGSPWSGKTPCYKNEVTEIGAVIRLKQASYNKMAKKNTVQAFTSLLSSCSCLKQAETIKEAIYDTVSLLTTIIPTYGLECLPDKDAVNVCKEEIVNKANNEDS